MRFSTKSKSRAPVMSMTSMLDVIFLLLFYFAARSVQAQWESDVKISLPKAKNAEAPARLPGELVVNVHADEPDTVTVNNMKLTHKALGEKLARLVKLDPDQSVVIRADGATAYTNLVKVIDACRGAGVYNFSLATQDKADGQKKADAR